MLQDSDRTYLRTALGSYATIIERIRNFISGFVGGFFDSGMFVPFDVVGVLD